MLEKCDKNFLSRLPKINIYNNQLKELDEAHLKMFIRFCFSRIRNLLLKDDEKVREAKLKEFKQISNFDDEQQFFETIRKIVNPSATELYSSRPTDYLIVRAERRADQIQKLNKDDIFSKVKVVADIGTGDGLISKTVTQKCFKNAKQLYMFEPYVAELKVDKKYNFDTHFIKQPFDEYGDNGTDVKYDCIMLITALHHIMNPLAVVEKIKQSLNKNGLLILREHQPTSDQDKMYLDLQEKAWTLGFSREDEYQSYIDKKAFPEAYFTHKELLQLLKGFSLKRMFKEDYYINNGFACYFLFQYTGENQ